jgi:hypothetical protein
VSNNKKIDKRFDEQKLLMEQKIDKRFDEQTLQMEQKLEDHKA